MISAAGCLVFLLTGLIIRAAHHHRTVRLDEILASRFLQPTREGQQMAEEGRESPAGNRTSQPAISPRRGGCQIEVHCTLAMAIELVKSCATELPASWPPVAVRFLHDSRGVAEGTLARDRSWIWFSAREVMWRELEKSPVCVQLRALPSWNVQFVPGVTGLAIFIKYAMGPVAAILFAAAAMLAICGAALWARPPVDIFADRLAGAAEKKKWFSRPANREGTKFHGEG